MAELHVGFAGLGNMGAGMAYNVQKMLKSKGSQLRVWNRTKDKELVKMLLDEGAEWVDTPEELAKQCDVIFAMLGSDAAVETVLSALISAPVQSGAIVIECSTVDPDIAVKYGEKLQKCGATLLTGPVFGRPDAAKDGTVMNVIAGDPAAKTKIWPLLESMGRGIMDVGDHPRQGYVMKLVGNFYVDAMSELIAEGMTLGDRNGVSRKTLLEYFKNVFPSPIIKDYSERIAFDDFEIRPGEPVFNTVGGLKDVTHILNLGKASGVPLPIMDLTSRRMIEVRERGGGEKLDLASIALLVREDAGIEVPEGLLDPKPKT